MKVVIAGGTGQVGRMLQRGLSGDGVDLVVLSRSNAAAAEGHEGVRFVRWDGESLGPWVSELDGAHVLINLAGRSVNCRYHQRNRDAIMQSRLRSTRVLGEAMAATGDPPRVWLQASTATIYAHRYDAANDEATGILGGDEPNAPSTWRFSIDVATGWEREALAAAERCPSTRLVLMRSAMTMSPDAGGVFDTMARLVRLGLGGTNGDGRQYMSWIHEVDFVRAVRFLMERDDLDGAINLASPQPMPNAEFMRTLRRALHAKLGLPATRWMLEIGALLLRTETELILKSRHVVPTRLTEAGFAFVYPDWPSAAAELADRWKRGALPTTIPA